MNFKLQVSSVEGKYSILWVEALCDDEEARHGKDGKKRPKTCHGEQ